MDDASGAAASAGAKASARAAPVKLAFCRCDGRGSHSGHRLLHQAAAAASSPRLVQALPAAALGGRQSSRQHWRQAQAAQRSSVKAAGQQD